MSVPVSAFHTQTPQEMGLSNMTQREDREDSPDTHPQRQTRETTPPPRPQSRQQPHRNPPMQSERNIEGCWICGNPNHYKQQCPTWLAKFQQPPPPQTQRYTPYPTRYQHPPIGQTLAQNSREAQTTMVRRPLVVTNPTQVHTPTVTPPIPDRQMMALGVVTGPSVGLVESGLGALQVLQQGRPATATYVHYTYHQR